MAAPLRLLLLCCSLLLLACTDGAPEGDGEIRAFTAKMRWEPGYLPFYVDEDAGKLYLLLGPEHDELLYQASLPRGLGSNDIGLDRGQLLWGGAALVRFEPVGERVLLRRLNTRYRADTEVAAERRSVEEAFASSVLWGFPVVARDGETRLVDATEFLLRDSHGVARRLKEREQGSFKLDASRSALYLPRSRAFPRNTELEAIISFTGDEPGEFVQQVAPDPHAITVHTHHSFIALPEPGYRPRRFHPESGFWPVVFADYAAPITADIERRLIPRHRLEKRKPRAKRSEPVEPIVYYLDPGTPEPVRSALLAGARWWNEAFSAAGFVDAFRVEMLPEDADPMDVRYNVIQWVHRATRGWSYGSSVIDPRSGEIIKGHVTLGSLRVRQDLLIARGMTAPFGDDGPGDELTSALALSRIRQLSAHEIGHTLGLAHNFAASPRDRASVMDYPYMRLVLDASGEVRVDDAYATGIGAWDKRTILYGYGEFGDGEDDALADLLAENRARGFEFIADPDSRDARDFHPRSHLWDNGADPVAELRRLLTLRAAALGRFGVDSIPDHTPLGELEDALVPVYLFHRYQVEAVGKLIGGVDYRYAVRGELAPDEVPVRAVAPARQRAALAALLETLEPAQLAVPEPVLAQIPPRALGYERGRESPPSHTGALFDPLTLAGAAAGHTLDSLLHRERLARLALQHSLDDAQLSLDALFSLLQVSLLEPEFSGYHAALDRRRCAALLSRWRDLAVDSEAAVEVRAASMAALSRAHSLLSERARDAARDRAYQAFYDLQARLTAATLAPDADVAAPPRPPLPPGSPIGAGP
jgi:hypothetical protein